MNQDRRALKFQADIRMSLHRTLCAAGNQCLPAGYKSDKLTSGKRPKGYKTVILQ